MFSKFGHWQSVSISRCCWRCFRYSRFLALKSRPGFQLFQGLSSFVARKFWSEEIKHSFIVQKINSSKPKNPTKTLDLIRIFESVGEWKNSHRTNRFQVYMYISYDYNSSLILAIAHVTFDQPPLSQIPNAWIGYYASRFWGVGTTFKWKK